MNVVAIRRTTEQHDDDGPMLGKREELLVAMPDSVVHAQDVLLLIGKDEDIKNFPAG